MQLKKLTNDKELWESFNIELEERIAFVQHQLEQREELVEVYRFQGEIKALRSLKLLRDKLNAFKETF